jgi:hypothetical protein
LIGKKGEVTRPTFSPPQFRCLDSKAIKPMRDRQRIFLSKIFLSKACYRVTRRGRLRPIGISPARSRDPHPACPEPSSFYFRTMTAATRKQSPNAAPSRAGKKSAHRDVFKKWRGRGALPDGLSVDAYISRARTPHRR